MIDNYKQIIDSKLYIFCKQQNLHVDQFQEALCYSLLNGGKRLRAILMLSIVELKRPLSEEDYKVALALEMMHAYSLIHDDLPAMDNALLRRNLPTNHIVFGEDLAILAGDGLNTNTFNVISSARLPSDKVVEIIKILSAKAGIYGMVLGQAADILSSINKLKKSDKWLVNFIHKNKTARFLQACCEIGAVLGDFERDIFSKFGLYLGMSYQIIDDYLDVVSDKKTLGKDKKDIDNNTLTYPRVYGMEKSLELANKLKSLAIGTIKKVNGSEKLVELAEYIVKRVN
ncbi:Octaprenyl diphosphate synthase / Dimethylallyltransferase / (2E,6E)-farnesyl diphosphate synthase [Desulfurella amilsii]|uniref:Octaprenyl diphosphate synthase / Dimethylallyltransferase / (2E,6E)-farnesyl diphosphate synthase n=1 Tax=Desulfurella amilsii TaxID=1562698 RepID=A0A1X4XXG4_9BACT|nr:polyprenyl synthetase family protein [Desulfurella amilsii]OSS42214.1 Octaprenyl diphosphate synthase / Dimethylallyltransferase / (2E,6E)-farnesyl diphosphate synthase [Desulfurella amilsii]